MIDRRLVRGLAIFLMGAGLMRVAFGPRLHAGMHAHFARQHWGHHRGAEQEGELGERPLPPMPPIADAMLERWHRKAHGAGAPQTA